MHTILIQITTCRCWRHYLLLSAPFVYNLYLRSVSLSRSDDCYRVYTAKRCLDHIFYYIFHSHLSTVLNYGVTVVKCIYYQLLKHQKMFFFLQLRPLASVIPPPLPTPSLPPRSVAVVVPPPSLWAPSLASSTGYLPLCPPAQIQERSMGTFIFLTLLPLGSIVK